MDFDRQHMDRQRLRVAGSPSTSKGGASRIVGLKLGENMEKERLGDIIRGGGARFQIRSPSFTFLDLRVFCAQLLPIVVF